MQRFPWAARRSVWACSCCGRAGVREVRRAAHRGQALACPSCDELPALPQAPWDGVLERWADELRGDG